MEDFERHQAIPRFAQYTLFQSVRGERALVGDGEGDLASFVAVDSNTLKRWGGGGFRDNPGQAGENRFEFGYGEFDEHGVEGLRLEKKQASPCRSTSWPVCWWEREERPAAVVKAGSELKVPSLLHRDERGLGDDEMVENFDPEQLACTDQVLRHSNIGG